MAEGASKANSAIVHAGFDAKPGTNKAKFNVLGNRMFEDTCRELKVPFRRNGSLVLAFGAEDEKTLAELKARGEQNGVPTEIISQDELRRREPNVSPEATAALWAPTGGICCPYELTFRFAENAAANGAEFFFDAKVENVVRVAPTGDYVSDAPLPYRVSCADGREVVARAVVNCAGVHSDEISNLVCHVKYSITARRGEYLMLDRDEDGTFSATSEAIVQHGVLKQGSATALGTTPKISVENGGTFDINAKTIRQETPIYIAGAGAGNWPWALATSSAMASGNYLYNLYLNADATIGKGQFKFGQDGTASKIKLNGHTLAAQSWMTLRNINTDSGTIDLQPGNGTGISLNQYNNLNTGSGYRGTTLILRSGTSVTVQNRGTYNFAVVDTLKWYGGTLTTDPNNTDRGFGVRVVLEGYGTTKYLKFLDGAKFKPDGEHYLNVTEKLSGTVTVDLSAFDFTSRTKRIPLLKVPTALKTTAEGALDVTRPKGWSLQTYESDGNVRYDLRKDEFSITIR